MLLAFFKSKSYAICCLSLITSFLLMSCEPELVDNNTQDTSAPVIQVTGMPNDSQTMVEPYQLQLDAQNSSGANLNYTWKLDNNVVSNSEVFTETLNAGSYVITLLVSNGQKTTTQIFNINIQAAAIADADQDSVPDLNDMCAFTPLNTAVDVDGCSSLQLSVIEYNNDDDNDGTINGLDQCVNTTGVVVLNGCSQAQIDANSSNTDTDGDLVLNANDQCPGTALNTPVDVNGCSSLQLSVIEYNNDDDNDGTINGLDQCVNTTGIVVLNGCSQAQLDVISGMTDSDNDGVPDANDQCQNTYGTDTDGCLLASEIYANDCESCHGNTQGKNVVIGGGLTSFECETCGSHDSLSLVIETTMPYGDAGQCDQNCANKLATYIISEFDGYGDNLTGEQLYKGLCETCHGDGEQATGLTAPQLIPTTCSVCDDAQTLITKITNTMPFNDSDKCDLDCATKVTQYMMDTFSGYAQVVEASYKNLNAKGDLSFAFVNNQLQISWQQRDQIPQSWLLERLNESTQQWDALFSGSGEITTYTDAEHSIGLYRLYAITETIASVPVYGKASATQIEVDNGAAWGESDGIFYMHKSVTGNFTAEVTLHMRNEPSQWTKIGLMARETNAANSKHIAGYYNGNNELEVTGRATTSGETDWLAGGGADLPVRLRMQRTGNTMVFSTKEEGADWVQITSQTTTLPNNIEIGVSFASNYGLFPLVAQISAFTIDNQIIDDYTQTNMGNFDDAIVKVDAPVNNDDSQISINPKVDEQDLARINRFVFTNQLKDISQQDDLEFNLSQDDTSTGFEVGLNSSALSIEKYLTAAENFAQIVAPSVQAQLTCELDDSGCINEFVTQLATQYLRSTPSEQQITNLNNVYWIINDQLGQSAAIQGLIETLVQSPAFLYQFESDGANMPAGTSVPVTGVSMAYRLANTLWGGMPDTQLLTAALRGELSTPAQIKAQAQRMVEDEKAERGFSLFYRQWLELTKLPTTQKDIAGIDFDELAPQMLEAMDYYMNSIVFDEQTPSSFTDLFTAPLVANNQTLASITNIPSNSTQMSMAQTLAENGDQRTGLLGQPAMLALLGHAQTTSIVHRGVFVSKQLMCAGFPAPPQNVPQLDSIDTQGKSSRQVLDELTGVAGCIDCHKLINPVGAMLEHFDTVGRSRLYDDLGVVVDSSADIYSRSTGTVDGHYNGLKEFNEYLASLDSVKSCFVSQYLTYAIGRVPSSLERSSVNWLVDQLDSNDGNIKQMLVEATQTPVFLYKKTKQAGE